MLMEIKTVIDQVKTLKKGMKITLAIGEDDVKEVMKGIYNFMDRDLIVDFSIDADAEKEKLNKITPDQRKKIYALFRDIADSTGNDKDSIKQEMKLRFIQNTDFEREEISLATCSREEAANFIEYIINFAFEYGIVLSDHPKEAFEDIEPYIRLCIKHKKCAVCGVGAEIHHAGSDRIGMGRDRKTVDDSDSKVIPLCREHHSELHSMPEEEFMNKYHVKPVVRGD